MRFSYKIFKTGGDTMLAIADSAAVGKTYSDGRLRIEVSKDFYSGKSCNETEAARLVRGATIINAVGKDIISVLVKIDIVDERSVLYIKGVPHAQVITV